MAADDDGALMSACIALGLLAIAVDVLLPQLCGLRVHVRFPSLRLRAPVIPKEEFAQQCLDLERTIRSLQRARLGGYRHNVPTAERRTHIARPKPSCEARLPTPRPDPPTALVPVQPLIQQSVEQELPSAAQYVEPISFLPSSAQKPATAHPPAPPTPASRPLPACTDTELDRIERFRSRIPRPTITTTSALPPKSSAQRSNRKRPLSQAFPARQTPAPRAPAVEEAPPETVKIARRITFNELDTPEPLGIAPRSVRRSISTRKRPAASSVADDRQRKARFGMR